MLCETLGANVRKYRKRRCWSQERLAEHAGICIATVSKIERGRTNPTTDVIESLSIALEIDMTLLIVDAESND